jgi:programmed cell death 6-interacting protein
MRELNLPSSLEALERPIGLPPSLLRKAEEVRTEEGVAKIETWIESVQTLSQHVSDLLEEAMDILDNEASEDENARMECDLQRPPSHIANKTFIDKGCRYREILEQAKASDALVRSKWEEWEQNIIELTTDEATLEASVPSSANQTHTAHGAQTEKHARSLRKLLESAEEGRRNRAQLVDRAKRLAEADDITKLISRKATAFEQFADVQPFMFEDVSDKELKKYDRFIANLQEAEEIQNALLEQIRVSGRYMLS